jgi:hypothetical protein
VADVRLPWPVARTRLKKVLLGFLGFFFFLSMAWTSWMMWSASGKYVRLTLIIIINPRALAHARAREREREETSERGRVLFVSEVGEAASGRGEDRGEPEPSRGHEVVGLPPQVASTEDLCVRAWAVEGFVSTPVHS